MSYYQKYVDEASKKESKDILIPCARTLLVAELPTDKPISRIRAFLYNKYPSILMLKLSKKSGGGGGVHPQHSGGRWVFMSSRSPGLQSSRIARATQKQPCLKGEKKEIEKSKQKNQANSNVMYTITK